MIIGSRNGNFGPLEERVTSARPSTPRKTNFATLARRLSLFLSLFLAPALLIFFASSDLCDFACGGFFATSRACPFCIDPLSVSFPAAFHDRFQSVSLFSLTGAAILLVWKICARGRTCVEVDGRKGRSYVRDFFVGLCRKAHGVTISPSEDSSK